MSGRCSVAANDTSRGCRRLLRRGSRTCYLPSRISASRQQGPSRTHEMQWTKLRSRTSKRPVVSNTRARRLAEHINSPLQAMQALETEFPKVAAQNNLNGESLSFALALCTIASGRDMSDRLKPPSLNATELAKGTISRLKVLETMPFRTSWNPLRQRGFKQPSKSVACVHLPWLVCCLNWFVQLMRGSYRSFLSE